MRQSIVVLLMSAALFGGQTPAPTQTLEEQIAAAERRVRDARPRTIAEAETEGAAYPKAAWARGGDPRTCLVVKPERIVFPTTKGDPRDYNLVFGDFFAGSISFGWGPMD